eukprot:Mrub_05043.p1 GENE.Mrub_05043~~Mrub_05043.p1  ORF type:complete len:379 (+),score=92.30 Mrub_05043:3-1139(+)
MDYVKNKYNKLSFVNKMYYTNDIMKLETNNNLWFQPYSYDPATFQTHDLQIVKKSNYDPLSVIRWRYVLDKDNKPEMVPNTNKFKTETNCRILKWQDGTYSLIVGKRHYNLKCIKAKNSFIFENKKDINTGNLCYDYVGTTKYKMSARPTKDILQINQNPEEDEKIENLKRIKSIVNYESMKKQMEIEEERKGNEEYKRIKNQLRNEKFRDRKFYTEEYLEDGAEKRTSRRKKTSKYSSSEEEEAAEEYNSEDDDFIDDREEIEGGSEHEDEEAEADDDSENEDFQYKIRSDYNNEDKKDPKSKSKKGDKAKINKPSKDGEKKRKREMKKEKKYAESEDDDFIEDDYKGKKSQVEEPVIVDAAPKKIKKLDIDSEESD